MTLKQLRERVSYGFSGYGHYRVEIDFRGKKYDAITTNMMAIDRAGDDDFTREIGAYYETPKQALQTLYNEVKDKNDLK